jgi:hypothetical protein
VFVSEELLTLRSMRSVGSGGHSVGVLPLDSAVVPDCVAVVVTSMVSVVVWV